MRSGHRIALLLCAAVGEFQQQHVEDHGLVVVSDEFISSAERATLLESYELAAARDLTSWRHGDIKGPAESVGHTTAGELHDTAMSAAQSATFCAVRGRMLAFARAVVANGTFGARAAGRDVVPDYTAFLQYRSGGQHGPHVDNVGPGLASRVLSMSLHLDSRGDAFASGGEFSAWAPRDGHLINERWYPNRSSAEPTIVSTRAGRLVLFLAETPHAVAPVARGTRRALFLWLADRPLPRNALERQLCGGGHETL